MGYRGVYHGYSTVFDSPRDCEMWLEGLRAKFDGVGKPFGRAEFDKLLGHTEVDSFPPILSIPKFSKQLHRSKRILILFLLGGFRFTCRLFRAGTYPCLS